MISETFLRLQHSEGIVCEMASRFLSAYIASGQINPENEDDLIERSVVMAIKLAQKADRAIESDGENGDQ